MWRDVLICLIPIVLAGVVYQIIAVASLRAEVDDIMNNHLAHIYQRLQSMDEYLRKQF